MTTRIRPVVQSAGGAHQNIGRIAFEGPTGEGASLPLLDCGGSQVTEEEFEGLVTAWRDAFRAAGVGVADRVLLWGENSIGTVAAYFGVWDLGAAIVPVNPSAPRAEVERIGRATGARAWVVEAASAAGSPELASGGAGRAVLLFGAAHTPAETAETISACGAGMQSPGPSQEAAGTAAILYTSGTTGSAKGIRLLHSDLIRSMESMLGQADQQESDRRRGPHLCCFPLSHVSGLMGMLYGLRARRPLILLRRFNTLEFRSAVRAYGLKYVVLTPSMLTEIMADETAMRSDLATIRAVRTLAAPLPASVARVAWESFGIKTLNSYGLTETAGEVIGWTGDDLERWFPAKIGSVGRPHPGVEIRITDSESGALLPEGAIGELTVRAPFAFDGYWGAGPAVADGSYLPTGDLAVVDEDGFVWLHGRNSDAINRGGFKIIPEEVEDVLLSHPAVEDAMVAGIPDDRLGQVPVAFLVLGALAGEATLGDIVASLDRHVARYKLPTSWYSIGEIPRTANGKIRRILAAELIANGAALPLK